MANRKNKNSQPEPKREQKATAANIAGEAAQHSWRNIRLIVSREYRNQVSRRSYRTMTIILIVVVVAAAFIPTIVQVINSRSHAQTLAAIVNNAGGIAGLDEATLLKYIGTSLNGENPTGTPPYAISIQPISNLSNLQSQLKDGEIGILLVIDRAADGSLDITYYTHSSQVNDSNLPKIQALAQQLTFLDTAQRLGLDSAQISSLLTPPNLKVVYPTASRPTNEIIAGYVLAFAAGILVLLAVAMYGNIIATGVAEEKSSRVMEILINAATPFQLLTGKIVGIGLASLTQMGALVVLGIGAILLQIPIQNRLFGPNPSSFIHYLTDVSIPYYLIFFMYFILEFFMYATLYASLGSLARRQDEVQGLVALPQLLVTFSFYIIYLGVFAPESTATIILSYIPFFSPTMMLARLALGTVTWWQIAITVSLMLAVTYIFTLISARLYRYGVLMYGQRPSIRTLLSRSQRE
jgi:ABC-2 type transport system permease protein